MTKSLPKHYVFLAFYCCCALKYHAGVNILIGGRESFENGRWFLANVAVNACQGLATLPAAHSPGNQFLSRPINQTISSQRAAYMRALSTQ
jgi:hypothetical protein